MNALDMQQLLATSPMAMGNMSYTSSLLPSTYMGQPMSYNVSSAYTAPLFAPYMPPSNHFNFAPYMPFGFGQSGMGQLAGSIGGRLFESYAGAQGYQYFGNYHQNPMQTMRAQQMDRDLESVIQLGQRYDAARFQTYTTRMGIMSPEAAAEFARSPMMGVLGATGMMSHIMPGGSAANFARRSFAAFQNNYNPNTGMVGMGGEEARVLTQGLMEHFMPNGVTNIRRTHGFGIEQVGEMMYAGAAYNALDFGRAYNSMSAEQQQRVKLDMVDRMGAASFRSTYGSQTTTGFQFDEAKLGAAAENIRQNKIADQVEKFAEVLGIMAEMSQPGAPMEQLVANLQKVSGGSLGKTSLSSLKQMLTSSQDMAAVAGIDTDTAQLIMAQGAQSARMYGMSGGWGMQAAMHAAMVTNITQKATPGPGTMNSTEILNYVTNAQQQYVKSPVGQFSAGVMRMVEELGGAGNIQDPRLKQLVADIQAQNGGAAFDAYRKGGIAQILSEEYERQGVYMSQSQVQGSLYDAEANKPYIEKYKTEQAALAGQVREQEYHMKLRLGNDRGLRSAVLSAMQLDPDVDSKFASGMVSEIAMGAARDTIGVPPQDRARVMRENLAKRVEAYGDRVRNYQRAFKIMDAAGAGATVDSALTDDELRGLGMRDAGEREQFREEMRAFGSGDRAIIDSMSRAQMRQGAIDLEDSTGGRAAAGIITGITNVKIDGSGGKTWLELEPLKTQNMDAQRKASRAAAAKANIGEYLRSRGLSQPQGPGGQSAGGLIGNVMWAAAGQGGSMKVGDAFYRALGFVGKEGADIKGKFGEIETAMTRMSELENIPAGERTAAEEKELKELKDVTVPGLQKEFEGMLTTNDPGELETRMATEALDDVQKTFSAISYYHGSGTSKGIGLSDEQMKELGLTGGMGMAKLHWGQGGKVTGKDWQAYTGDMDKLADYGVRSLSDRKDELVAKYGKSGYETMVKRAMSHRNHIKKRMEDIRQMRKDGADEEELIAAAEEVYQYNRTAGDFWEDAKRYGAEMRDLDVDAVDDTDERRAKVKTWRDSIKNNRDFAITDPEETEIYASGAYEVKKKYVDAIKGDMTAGQMRDVLAGMKTPSARKAAAATQRLLKDKATEAGLEYTSDEKAYLNERLGSIYALRSRVGQMARGEIEATDEEFTAEVTAWQQGEKELRRMFHVAPGQLLGAGSRRTAMAAGLSLADYTTEKARFRQMMRDEDLSDQEKADRYKRDFLHTLGADPIKDMQDELTDVDRETWNRIRSYGDFWNVGIGADEQWEDAAGNVSKKAADELSKSEKDYQEALGMGADLTDEAAKGSKSGKIEMNGVLKITNDAEQEVGTGTLVGVGLGVGLGGTTGFGVSFGK